MYLLNSINQPDNINKTSEKFEKTSPKYIKKWHFLKLFAGKNIFYIYVCGHVYIIEDGGVGFYSQF